MKMMSFRNCSWVSVCALGFVIICAFVIPIWTGFTKSTSSITAKDIVKIAQSFGFKAYYLNDTEANVVLSSGKNGVFVICSDNDNVIFKTTLEQGSLQFSNLCNKVLPFGRTFVDDDGNVCYIQSFSITGGVSYKNLGFSVFCCITTIDTMRDLGMLGN